MKYKKIETLLIIVIGVFLFSYGVGVGKYEWFPHDIFKRIQDIDGCDENPYKEDCTDRKEVIGKIRNGAQYEYALSEVRETYSDPIAARETLIESVVSPETLVRISKLETNEKEVKISANMYGISVHGILSKSAQLRSKCLSIYIQGHQGDPFRFDYHNKLLDKANAKGCDFLSFSMLGRGVNEGNASFPTQFGKRNLDSLQATQHDNYAQFFDKNNPELDPLSLFLSPHYWIIKSIASDYGIIDLIGISGGGWQTVLLGALIPDIHLSISYAGTLPFTYKPSWGGGGDWEQNFSSIYERLSYWKLYSLMTVDSNGRDSRQAVFIFNDNDTCCFSDPQASHFQAIVELMGLRNWSVMVDRSDTHSMNVELLTSILK